MTKKRVNVKTHLYCTVRLMTLMSLLHGILHLLKYNTCKKYPKPIHYLLIYFEIERLYYFCLSLTALGYALKNSKIQFYYSNIRSTSFYYSNIRSEFLLLFEYKKCTILLFEYKK